MVFKDYVELLSKELGVRIPSFGHAGDGNLHVYICRDELSDTDWTATLAVAFEKMYEKTQGSILIISHQEKILNIADKIVVIADGQIQNVGKKEDVLPKLLAAESCRVLTDKV